MIRRDDILEPVVGGIVLLVVALMIAFSYGEKKVEGAVDGYPVQASFSKVDGLSEGAEVQLSGIRVGTVASQQLNNYYRANLTLMIDSGVKLPLDTSAAIHTDGVFGGKYVVLEPGGEYDMIQPGGTIEFTQGSVVVEDLLELIIAQGRARLAKSKEE